MKWTNKFNLPEPLFRALTEDRYKKVGDISVTSLLKTPRQRLLAERHDAEIVGDASWNLWSLLGTAVHHIVERGAKNVEAISEERLTMEVKTRFGTWVVSGAPDLWMDDVVWDYKTSGTFTFIVERDNGGVKPEWEAQLNMYAELYRQAGFKVNGLRIQPIMRDWMKSKAEIDPEYPKCPMTPYVVKMWPRKETQAFIKQRVEIHQAAVDTPDEDLEMCSPEERWERGEKWAVMKGAAKRAFRTFTDPAEADECAAAVGGKVVHRPGKANRCDPQYCHGAPFCSFFQELEAKKKGVPAGAGA